MEAQNLPAEIEHDLDNLVELAGQQAYEFITDYLDNAGYEVSGDIAPWEMGPFTIIEENLKTVTRMLALNNPVIAAMNREGASASLRTQGPMTDHFTLEEFGDDNLSSSATDEEGNLMRFRHYSDAVEMARFMLGADHDGPEREPREGMKPFIGILQVDVSKPDMPTSWAAGYVTIDGKEHEGDYENAPELWGARDEQEGADLRALGSRFTPRVSAAVEPDEDTRRLDLVEWAWYEVAKGELQVGTTEDDDPKLSALCLRLWDEVVYFTTTFDVPQDDIEETSDRAIALRVAWALHRLWYGGEDAWGLTDKS